MKKRYKTTTCGLALPALALAFLTGCGNMEPIHISDNSAEERPISDIGADIVAATDDFTKSVESFFNAAPADQTQIRKDTQPKIMDARRNLRELFAERERIYKKTPDAKAKYNSEFVPKINADAASVAKVLVGLKAIPNKTQDQIGFLDDLTFAVGDIDEADKTAVDKASSPPPQNQAPLPKPDPPGGSGAWIMSFGLLTIIAACAGVLYPDGIWGNSIRLVNVVMSGLLAMAFFEPLAKFMTGYEKSFIAIFDFLAIWLIFALAMMVFRTITDSVSKVQVKFPKVIDQVGGAILALWIGWVMAGFTLTTLHTAPLTRTFMMGGFQPDQNMFFGVLAPDQEWLAFTKRVSDGAFAGEREFESPNSFINKQYLRRKNIEAYVLHLPPDQRSVRLMGK